ncbi:aldo/keto reductase [Frankia sp. Cj3]|uniref:aldo/keto reductase n=1 Tax=Frankia sp. Cj3 TaxID=2880976 RepID=UPI001EF40A5F|nr:aldo/keto reductase [Frankia sp. Cj3]
MRQPDTRIVLGLHRSRHERGLLESALDLGIRNIDTAFNYAGFRSHAILFQTAADLLPCFFVSTKVGFFPGAGGRNDHSLEPGRLQDALETTAATLGQAPDVVFLHNPERSLGDLEPAHAADHLAAAAGVLTDAVAAGLCRSWGISTWNPQPVLAAAIAVGPRGLVRPWCLMHRAGILVPARVLDAIDDLAGCLEVETERRWGMSPFGGDTGDSVWRTLALRPFMAAGEECSTAAAAFRLAFALPPVGRVAVGTNRPEHLADLVRALDLGVDGHNVERFRDMLARRQAHAAG